MCYRYTLVHYFHVNLPPEPLYLRSPRRYTNALLLYYLPSVSTLRRILRKKLRKAKLLEWKLLWLVVNRKTVVLMGTGSLRDVIQQVSFKSGRIIYVS